MLGTPIRHNSSTPSAAVHRSCENTPVPVSIPQRTPPAPRSLEQHRYLSRLRRPRRHRHLHRGPHPLRLFLHHQLPGGPRRSRLRPDLSPGHQRGKVRVFNRLTQREPRSTNHGTQSWNTGSQASFSAWTSFFRCCGLALSILWGEKRGWKLSGATIHTIPTSTRTRERWKGSSPRVASETITHKY